MPHQESGSSRRFPNSPTPTTPPHNRAAPEGTQMEVVVKDCADNLYVIEVGVDDTLETMRQKVASAVGLAEDSFCMGFGGKDEGGDITELSAGDTIVLTNTNAPQIPGEWGDVRLPDDCCVITQIGATLHITNTTQPWSPAEGIINEEGEVSFTAGLVGLTAQYDRIAQRLDFSNGCAWEHIPAAVSSVSLAGKWGDVRLLNDRSFITQRGTTLHITNTTQPWSPAQGNIDEEGKVNFITGFSGLTAQYDETAERLAFSNGCAWERIPAASTHEVFSVSLAGKWGDVRLPNDRCVITPHSGTTLHITNTAQPWSPAQGSIDEEGKVNFTSGLIGLTAQYDETAERLAFERMCLGAHFSCTHKRKALYFILGATTKTMQLTVKGFGKTEYDEVDTLPSPVLFIPWHPNPPCGCVNAARNFETKRHTYLFKLLKR